MKQVVLNLKNGEITLEEIPAPVVSAGSVLIRSRCSLVSAGTERSLIEFGRANILNKAKQQPDKVKQVLRKIKTDGLFPTMEAIFRRLDEPLPLGYCNAGEIIAVGENVHGFAVGDRVVSNGHHAEVVAVPRNLVAKIPENVSDEEASFTVIASVALQGIRLIEPAIGEVVVVIGLGLIGLIACALLRANGCIVIAVDIDDKRIATAKKLGYNAISSADASSCYTSILSQTADQGADAVLITAASDSDSIISLAAKITRKRGHVVLVGVVGLNLNREDFYKKEILFQVSASYGPGRYDVNYEEKGHDYPYAFARWTAQRNFEAILHLLEQRKIEFSPLISQKVQLADFRSAYTDMQNKELLGSLIEYPENTDLQKSLQIQNRVFHQRNAVAGVIGAGNFSKMSLLPNLYKQKVQVKHIASANGLNAKDLAAKYNIPHVNSDYRSILSDSEVTAIIIATRHDTHAQIVIDAIHADKHILVEKPLCITEQELVNIRHALEFTSFKKIIAVGFNRRYAPLISKLNSLLTAGTETNVIITVNAGFIASDSWLQDIVVGGGRIIGEACHFIDLAAAICNSKIKQVFASQAGNNFRLNADNVIIQLKMENGAQASVHYFSNGSPAYSKERIEIFDAGKTVIIDNFRKMHAFGYKNFSGTSARQDKGHLAQIINFINSVETGVNQMQDAGSAFNSMQATFAALKSMQLNQVVVL